MAYMDQKRKAERAPKIKEICLKHGVKARLSVHNHSTLILTVSQGRIDFLDNYNRVAGLRFRHDAMQYRPAKDYISVNPYWYREHFDGPALEFLQEVIPVMYGNDYFDHSDSQSDYFHCSHYIDVKIGRWDQPYALTTG